MQQNIISDVPQEGRQLSPPYVSYLTFKMFLEWLESEGVPLRFDRSFWSKRYSGSTGSQLMAGIRFLGLLINEEPTPLLECLVNARGDDRKERLREIYQQAYTAVDFEALHRATPGMLNEWFESYPIEKTTLRKAESFFVNALKDAEHPLSNSLRKLSRNKAGGGNMSGSTGPRRSRGRKEQQVDPPKTPPPASNPPEIPTDTADAQASLMLWGLFKRLPKPGAVFSESERTSWLEAAKTLFNLEYRVESLDGR